MREYREGDPPGPRECRLQGKLRRGMHRAGHGDIVPRSSWRRSSRMHPTASVYNLLGQVAALKGERARAEPAGTTRACAATPATPTSPWNLALLLRERGRHDEARDLLLSVLWRIPATRAPARSWTASGPSVSRGSSAPYAGGNGGPRGTFLPSPPFACAASRRWMRRPVRCPVCRKVYCVGCAAAHLREMRFYCPDDGEFLRLADDSLKMAPSARALEAASS